MTTVAQTALARLRELDKQGLLSADRGAVAPLLAEIASGDDGFGDLARAGQILTRSGSSDGSLPTVTVSITGHSTVEPLIAPLAAELARHGLVLRPVLGEFDSYVRDLQDADSHLYGADTDLALIVLDSHAVFDELPRPWQLPDLERAVTAKLAQLDRLAEQYTTRTDATLVLNTVPLLREHTHSLVDLRSRTRLGIRWREFNAGLLELAEKYPRVQVVDLDPLIAESGPSHDPRLAVYAKVRLGDEVLSRYAREIGHLARTLRGQSKKVLVVDLDNTMWDGVLGDDGPEGIAAASTLRGEAFRLFQHTVQQLGAQGVVLAVSSKNDREPVLAVLRDHPDMVLRDTDFARINANWQPKDANLADIAEQLNLSVDSFVFADDSAFETGLVAMSLPGVAVVRLDHEPALHAARLLADGWFDVVELTEDDRARGRRYRSDSARQDLLASAGSPDEYLRQLDVVVDIQLVRAADVPRISQLSLRTNQFNLTTQRLQPADVAARVADPDHLVLSVRTADRFGDNGLVGAVFARRAGDSLRIDNMVLSCRVFARGIEDAVLSTVLAYAKDTGLRSVVGAYLPSEKNGKVSAFYPSHGFSPSGDSFRHDLRSVAGLPGHLTVTTWRDQPHDQQG